ncbi:MAG: 3'-5' exonuclease [Acidimicrobiales bacterium]
MQSALGDLSSHPTPPAEEIDRLREFCAAIFPSKYDNFAARLADVEQLATSASAYNTRSRFLTELTLDPPQRTGDQAGEPYLDDDWLTLSTIHSAKGMEWRHVYLLHAADGNIPSDMAIGDKDGLAEELRLLYVAMTRAKDELTISVPLRYHVNRYTNDDRHLYAQMSRFLEPITDKFAQSTTGIGEEAQLPALIEGVGIADEVDTMLHSLGVSVQRGHHPH